MLKAGALYFTIVIAFIIAIVTASLIMLASHYRNSYLKGLRFERLVNNLNSGVLYLLEKEDFTTTETRIDLFGNQTDSLLLTKGPWGILEVAAVQSFILQDTLKKAFLIGSQSDTVVLYLSDEDRPLSLSGTTKITGNAFLPKAGLKKAYVEGKPYVNEKVIYNGSTNFSDRQLRKLDSVMIKQLQFSLALKANQFPVLDKDSLNASFFNPVQKIGLPKIATLQHIALGGNIILFSDSVVHNMASAKLNGIQIYAPIIKVEDGFVGNCQLFATEEISIGNKAIFNYPSVLGVMNNKKTDVVPTVKLGDEVQFAGVIFTYEEKRSPLQTMISLGKKAIVKGEVFSTGALKVEKGVVVNGKVSCNKFIMQTPTTLYENFLTDVTFNRLARSKYYLSSKLFGKDRENHILKWLN